MAFFFHDYKQVARNAVSLACITLAVNAELHTFGYACWNLYFHYFFAVYDTFARAVLTLVLIVAFAYFYILISFNPVEVSNNLKKNGGSIPGIRPGKPTVDYIKKILNRITQDLFKHASSEEINQNLKELVGHTPLQVVIGSALGLVIPFLMSLIPLYSVYSPFLL